MALCSEVYDAVGIVTAKDRLNRVVVGDVGLFKEITGTTVFLIDIDQAHQITGIGESIEVYNLPFEIGVCQEIPNEVGANEARSTGYNNGV